MSRFVLLPCHLRDNKLVPVKGAEPVTLNWRELAKKLAPSNRIEALKTLKHIQRGAFIGLLDQGNKPPSNFCFVGQDRSGNIGSVLRRNATFGTKLLEAYQVIEADRGSAILEAKTTSRGPKTLK